MTGARLRSVATLEVARESVRDRVEVVRRNALTIAQVGVSAGVAWLVARELLGDPQPLLEPFRFSRYAAGRLHPVSHSPFPWS